MNKKENEIDKIFSEAKDFLPILGIDYIEFYVGNAKQSAYFYKSALGFKSEAYSGLETGNNEEVSYVIKQQKIRFVLTSSYKKDSLVNEHYLKHGDGVKFVAFLVEDSKKSYEETIKRGAKSYLEPIEVSDEKGKIVKSGIYTYGETVHLFIERKNYKGVFLPGFQHWNNDFSPPPVGLKYVDHVVGNVGWNEMDKWCNFYRDVLGFTQIVSFDDNDISTEYTALMSKVMSNGNGRVKFPINEPAEGLNKSQIEEYLDFYNGPGVQHLALATDNIIMTVEDMKKRGIEFLYVPETYYDDLIERVGHIEEDVNLLRKNGILIDRDDDGYLLQIFTKPLVHRPTIFFEIIQRRGANSFGKGNFKALFLAIEREQRSRGTL